MKVAWLLLAALVLIAEAIGLVRGGPLTHFVRELQHTTTWRYLLYGLWVWLTWHWFIEWRATPGLMATRVDDAAAVCIGFLIALIAPLRRPATKNPPIHKD